MNRQPNRLAAAETHKLSGLEIDRGKPLSFRLNGRRIEGFAGDSVLSAVQAAGIIAAGRRGREPIALTERFAPAVLAAGADDPALALPMERMPALPDLELVTLGSLGERLVSGSPLARLRHLLRGPGRSLGLRLDEPEDLRGAGHALQPRQTLDTDTLVIGAGVAGMSAAVAAAAEGPVMLVERRPFLGGDARFFGALENEEAPDAAIARLTAQLAKLPAITVLTRSEAYGIVGTTARVHQVEVDGKRATGRTLVIRARRVVLATGAFERLPIFPGNRAPGVGGSVEAFQRADRYGVWLGGHALFSTPHNFGYRLALLAKDAGVRVERIADVRVNPQSRFIDFCKASGITLAGGLKPIAATRSGRGAGNIAVRFAVALDEVSSETAPLQAETCVAGGGWQPDLSLWLRAGGASGWNPQAARLEAKGGLDGVALAGAAAGFRNLSACTTSGSSAVATLLGRPAGSIDDPQIEAIYETPDAPAPATPGLASGWNHAFLGAGFGFATLTPPASRREQSPPVTALPRLLELEEVAAAVQVGDVPRDQAGSVAAERCREPGALVDSGWRVPALTTSTEPAAAPDYLAGRFGSNPALRLASVGDSRYFEPGCLLFLRSEETEPAKAVGVIVGAAPGGRSGGLALVAAANAAVGTRLFVRDTSGAVPVELAAERQDRKQPVS